MLFLINSKKNKQNKPKKPLIQVSFLNIFQLFSTKNALNDWNILIIVLFFIQKNKSTDQKEKLCYYQRFYLKQQFISKSLF